MKYKDENYCQIWNNAIEKLNKTNHKIPYSARWLYIHLNFLEHRFTGKGVNHFYRSIEDLRQDTQIGRRQIINGIKILKEIGLIETWQDYFVNEKTVNIPALKGGAFKTTLIAVARISHVFCDTLYIF